MTTLTIKRNGNPKIREEGWKGNKYLYMRGKLVISFWKGGGRDRLDYHKTQPHLELDLGLKKIKPNLCHPRLLCTHTYPNRGRARLEWLEKPTNLPSLGVKKIMNKHDHTNSLNRTRCLSYRYHNVSFKPMNYVKEHLFFMGLITGLPNR